MILSSSAAGDLFWFWTAAFFLIGLCLGSFASVLAARWPVRPDIRAFSGRSHCPSCGSTLKARNLIPLLSWLVQKGRCAFCAAPISVRYPLLECLAGCLAVGGYWLSGGPETAFWMLPAIPFLAAAVAAGGDFRLIKLVFGLVCLIPWALLRGSDFL